MFIFFDLPQVGLKYLSAHKGMTMEELCILIFFFVVVPVVQKIFSKLSPFLNLYSIYH